MQSDAKDRFIKAIVAHSARATENFDALMTLADRLVKAETVGYKLDPSSVEKAVKNIMGVD